MTHLIEERSVSPSEPITRRLTQRSGPLLLIAATVFAVDQLSKAIVRSRLAIGERWPSDFELIRFSHVENDGAAFGILQGAGPLLIVTTAVAIVVIVLTLIRAADQPRVYTIALALILGGAVGNLADRLARGAVTDFIDPTHYPSFNLADSAIVIGVSALLIYSLFERTPEDRAAEERA
jgi:signal peptidase II